ncbi:unnamed protein product [Closterium sp. NIES-53]
MLALCREHRLEHRTKHIALRYFLARELQQRGQLRLAYVASEANTADIFTKALAPGDHQRFCTLLGSLGRAASRFGDSGAIGPLNVGVATAAGVVGAAVAMVAAAAVANPDAPSPAPSPAPAPAASHESPPLASAPPPQPTATSRRRLADHYPPDVDKPAEPAAADGSAADAPDAPPAVRFLTYDWYGTCGGIGDYLIGLVSIFPAALLDRRALLVAQPCMHAAFRSPHIDTALSPDVPMGGKPLLRATPLDAPGAGAGDSNSNGNGDSDGDSNERHVEWHAPPCERLEGNLSAEVRDSGAVPCFNMVGQSFGIQDLQRHSALSNYRMRYNHGLLINTLLLDEGPWAAALRQLGFKVAYGFGCILRFLFRRHGVSAIHLSSPPTVPPSSSVRLLHPLLPLPLCSCPSLSSSPGPSPRPEVWQLVAGIEEHVWGEGVVHAERSRHAVIGIHPSRHPSTHSPPFLFRSSLSIPSVPSPRPEVWQLVAGIEEHVWGEGVVRVAVHLRVPDQTVWHMFEGMPLETSQQQLDELLAEANSTLQCAQTVEDFWYPPPLQVKWILITNSHPLKQALKAKYPDKVVATDFIPWHSDRATEHENTNLTSAEEREAAVRGLQHFRETVAEWALVASCHTFIIPASGFSRTAALYALRPLDMFIPPPDPCNPEEPTPISALRGSWSGI